MNLIEALEISHKVFDDYKANHPKWWKRMDGTPILNDVGVLMAEAFMRACNVTPSPETPDGFVLVPVEPTPEMIGAFWRQKNTGCQEPGKTSLDYRSDYDAYRAMIAACPTGLGSSQDHAPTADAAAETRPQDVLYRLQWRQVGSTPLFSVIDPEPNNDHSALYLVCPNGLMVDVSCDPMPGLDVARASWMAETLNAALSRPSPDTANPTSDEPKPVAWRLIHENPEIDEGYISVGDKNGAWAAQGYDVQPLFASPPSNKELVGRPESEIHAEWYRVHDALCDAYKEQTMRTFSEDGLAVSGLVNAVVDALKAGGGQ